MSKEKEVNAGTTNEAQTTAPDMVELGALKEKNAELEKALKDATEAAETAEREKKEMESDRQYAEEMKRKQKVAGAQAKKVKVKIPVDQLNKDNTSVPVCVNGYTYQIKRGVEVEIPENVKDILTEAGYL